MKFSFRVFFRTLSKNYLTHIPTILFICGSQKKTEGETTRQHLRSMISVSCNQLNEGGLYTVLKDISPKFMSRQNLQGELIWK